MGAAAIKAKKQLKEKIAAEALAVKQAEDLAEDLEFIKELEADRDDDEAKSRMFGWTLLNPEVETVRGQVWLRVAYGKFDVKKPSVTIKIDSLENILCLKEINEDKVVPFTRVYNKEEIMALVSEGKAVLPVWLAYADRFFKSEVDGWMADSHGCFLEVNQEELEMIVAFSEKINAEKDAAFKELQKNQKANGILASDEYFTPWKEE